MAITKRHFRALFEDWAVKRKFIVSLDKNIPCYSNTHTESAWQAFQASWQLCASYINNELSVYDWKMAQEIEEMLDINEPEPD